MKTFPVYVLSAGRWKTATTPRQLRVSGIPFTMVVEPEELEHYQRAVPYASFVVLDQSKQGNAYARKKIQEHSESLEHEYHWQLDDNIAKFQIRRDGKNIAVSAIRVITGCEQFVRIHTNIAISGPAYSVWAFGYADEMSLNRQAASCMLIKNHTGNYFRGIACVDTDLHMQMLTQGYCTMRFNRLLIDKMATGKLRGGCTDSDYVDKGREQACRDLVEHWPGSFKINPKDPSRIAPSRIWDTFNQQPIMKKNLKESE